MRPTTSLLLALLAAGHAESASCGDALAAYRAFDDTHVALVGVTVIDGSGGLARPAQTVLIDDGDIVAIGDVDAVDVPEPARRIDLPGRTVIPGMVGMHDHTHMPGVTLMRDTAPRLWLAAGVTTVQTAGAADAAGEIALAKDIAAGRIPGPEVFPSAPYLTGPGGNAPMDKPATPDEARAFVREWARRGATWIKLYRHIQPDIAAAAIDQAHAVGIKTTGHLCSLGFAEAARLGIDRIEHGLISATDIVPDKPSGACVSNRDALRAIDLDDAAVRTLIDTLVHEDVALTSTLAIVESHFPHRPQGDARALEAMAPPLRDAYRRRQAALRDGDAATRFPPALFAKLLDFERRFVAAGGRLMAGPDTGRHVLPGYGNQRNVELLIEAGFGVAETVRIVSANGAAELGIGDRTGTLRPGMQADLVVLRGALVEDASVIRATELVFSDGVAYAPDALLADVAGRVGAAE